MTKQKFDLAEWDVEKIIKMAVNNRMSLPKFQRGLSWSQPRKESLIATMREGNPIGTILLNQVIPNEKYQIIDGLQRISTILDYQNNFKKYFDETFIPYNKIDKIVEMHFKHINIKVDKNNKGYTDQIARLTELIIESYKINYGTNKHKNINFMRNVTDSFTGDYLQTMNSSTEMYRKFEDIIYEIFDYIEDNEKLENFDIPIIIYTGQESNLPDIFEKLNTGGVILSKYEIFSARWVNNNIGEVNDELYNLLSKKYDAISEEEEGYAIEYDDKNQKKDMSMNLFEYCFSLGEYVQNHYNLNKDNTLLFKKKKNVGFELLCLILTSRVNSTEYLEYLFGSKLLGYFNQNEHLSEDLFKSIKTVLSQMKFLDDFVISNNRTVMYSDYQKFHIFTSLYNYQYKVEHNIIFSDNTKYQTNDLKEAVDKTKYINNKNQKTIKRIDSNITKTKKSKSFIGSFKQNVIPVILLHTVNRHWDTNRQVIDLEYQIKNNGEVYFSNPDFNEIETSVVGWLDQQNNDEKYQKLSVPRDVQLVNTLLHHILELVDLSYKSKCNFANKIDFDHIIPKNKLRNLLMRTPISGALNIWPIYYKDNRRKKERNIDDIINKPINSIDSEYYNLIGIGDEAIFKASKLSDIKDDIEILSIFNDFLTLRRTDYIKLVLDVSRKVSTKRF